MEKKVIENVVVVWECQNENCKECGKEVVSTLSSHDFVNHEVCDSCEWVMDFKGVIVQHPSFSSSH